MQNLALLIMKGEKMDLNKKVTNAERAMAIISLFSAKCGGKNKKIAL